MKTSAYVISISACAGIFLSASAATETPGDKSPLYETALIEMRCDDAIRTLCAPLNQALKKQDYKLASRIMRLIAMAFRFDENDVAAAQAAGLAVKLCPEDRSAKFQLAEYMARDGLWQDSNNIYEDLSKCGDSADETKAAAYLAQQKGSVSQALPLLEKYCGQKPDDEKALLKLSQLYLINEENIKAAQTLRKLASRGRSAYFKEIYYARAEESEGKFKAAELRYKNAGEYNREDPLWHCQLAAMLMKQQAVKKADSEFRQCFASRRVISKAFSNWALLQAFFGSNENANTCLDHLQKLRPNSNELYFVRGIVEEKAGNDEKASTAFWKSIQLYPSNSSPYLHLLQSKTIKENTGKRIDFCRQWCNSCPHSAVAAIELGNALRDTGNLDGALQSYSRARDLLIGRALPKDSNYLIEICTMHANIAAILYKQKKIEEALESATEFNHIKPVSSTTAGLSVRPGRIETGSLTEAKRKAAEHAILADALYEARMLAEAEHEYREALSEEPDNVTFHSALLKVLLDKKDYAAAAREDAAVSQHVVTHIPDFFDKSSKKH